MKDKNKNYSEMIRRIRRQHEISQQDLAEEVGVTRVTLNKWEKDGMTYENFTKTEKALMELVATKGKDLGCEGCEL